MAIDSNILAWRIPWTEEPGGLQSMGSQSLTWLSNVFRINRSKKAITQQGSHISCLISYHVTYHVSIRRQEVWFMLYSAHTSHPPCCDSWLSVHRPRLAYLDLIQPSVSLSMMSLITISSDSGWPSLVMEGSVPQEKVDLKGVAPNNGMLYLSLCFFFLTDSDLVLQFFEI